MAEPSVSSTILSEVATAALSSTSRIRSGTGLVLLRQANRPKAAGQEV
jgi:hypothetical protein